MEKNKILNIVDNLSTLKENHKYYIEFNWGKVNLFVSRKYKYETVDFTLCDLLKKYRNKNTHSENPNSIENMLLPTVINDSELEDLQILMIEVINYELENCDINAVVTHIFKNGSVVISYKKIINSMKEIMDNASADDKRILEKPFLFIIIFFTSLSDGTLLTEEFFVNSYKDYIIVKDILTSDEFIKTLLNKPNGQLIFDFFQKSFDQKYNSNPFEALFELKKELVINNN